MDTLKCLEGHTIRRIVLDEGGYKLRIFTDTHLFVFKTDGECCTNAYLVQPEADDVDDIIGQKVIRTYSREYFGEAEGHDVVDTTFYSILTTFADLDLELRAEHNGYYGGWLVLVSQSSFEVV